MDQDNLSTPRSTQIAEVMQDEKREVYYKVENPSYDIYLPVLETILNDCCKRNKNCPKFQKCEDVNELPPGCNLIFCLYMISNRLDLNKAKVLEDLIKKGINVIVIVLRMAKGAYIDVENLNVEVDGKLVNIPTIRYMVYQYQLSHLISNASVAEKMSLVPNYNISMKRLANELELESTYFSEFKEKVFLLFLHIMFYIIRLWETFIDLITVKPSVYTAPGSVRLDPKYSMELEEIVPSGNRKPNSVEGK